jgi:uncharacterized protein YdhG (YjbR/CyaY superfamily)
MKDTKKSAKSTRATSTRAAEKSSGVLTDEELAALKETVQERKAAARRGTRADKAAEDEREALAKIAEMPAPDRSMAERIHKLVKASAPELSPRTWYGMPAYANDDGKVVCFFTPADKFKSRYATFGFEEAANLDDGNMWPTAFALTKLTAADEKRIAALVKKAAS